MSCHTAKSRETLFHFHWVSKIALWVAATAAAGLVVVLFVLTGKNGTTYEDLIQARSLTQQQLGPALLVSGIFLVFFGAIVTWLVALYSSFRIAGPLFRLTSNLETSLGSHPGKPIPIRAADRLQAEAALLDQSLGHLACHYAGLRNKVDRALHKLDTGDMPMSERQTLCEDLKKGVYRARF